jgi:F-type H+-transporting ATPase subunit c
MKKIVSLATLAMLVAPSLAMAEEAAGTSGGGIVGIGAALAIGLAALGGALAQGKLVSAGLESIGRNPASAGKLFVPLILGLVFVEAIVILSFVIAFGLSGKI